jgi:hypothetical protein
MFNSIPTFRSMVLGFSMVVVMFAFTGCFTDDSSDKAQAVATENILKEANAQIGMPNIVNFQQKKHMKMIYELCDQESVICWAYFKNEYTGKLVFINKCVGYGLPFSAQYTNPMKVAYSSSSGRIALPQADPNGLFMPVSSSASWVMFINPADNSIHPVYVEPEIIISPFKLH